jgi:hypothetical protein
VKKKKERGRKSVIFLPFTSPVGERKEAKLRVASSHIFNDIYVQKNDL